MPYESGKTFTSNCILPTSMYTLNEPRYVWTCTFHYCATTRTSIPHHERRRRAAGILLQQIKNIEQTHCLSWWLRRPKSSHTWRELAQAGKRQPLLSVLLVTGTSIKKERLRKYPPAATGFSCSTFEFRNIIDISKSKLRGGQIENVIRTCRRR